MTTHIAIVYILIRDGKVLLESRDGDNFWKIPGGHCEEDETPEETVLREAKEEIDCKVTVINAPFDFGPKPYAKSIPIPEAVYWHPVESDVSLNKPHHHLGFVYVVTTEDKIIAKEGQKIAWFVRKEVEKSLEIREPVKRLVLGVFDKYIQSKIK